MEKIQAISYSGFKKGEHEEPDFIPYEPTKSVSEFKEGLKALFGKFKTDLNNPEFIKGVAQIIVNWKLILRIELKKNKNK